MITMGGERYRCSIMFFFDRVDPAHFEQDHTVRFNVEFERVFDIGQIRLPPEIADVISAR